MVYIFETFGYPLISVSSGQRTGAVKIDVRVPFLLVPWCSCVLKIDLQLFLQKNFLPFTLLIPYKVYRLYPLLKVQSKGKTLRILEPIRIRLPSD